MQYFHEKQTCHLKWITVKWEVAFPLVDMATATTAKPKKVGTKKEKIIGIVTHYYDNIGVAILELVSPIAVGDTVRFWRGDQEFTQEVTSMHVEHKSVKRAKKGEIIGMKVDEEVKKGAFAFAA